MTCARFPIASRRFADGFTMIEIAIALGVIGFALVAIIGILPSGLEVQRDNRSETIINQDATFWLEAIRNGAQGLEELPSYVDKIVISNSFSKTSTTYSNFARGAQIIGLLTTGAVDTNAEARAYVTAISGSAAEKDPNPANRELAFGYVMRVLIEPATNSTVPFSFLSSTYEPLTSLYEMRLTFSYPFLRETQAPSRSQSFRALVNRNVVTNLVGSEEYYFFTP